MNEGVVNQYAWNNFYNKKEPIVNWKSKILLSIVNWKSKPQKYWRPGDYFMPMAIFAFHWTSEILQSPNNSVTSDCSCQSCRMLVNCKIRMRGTHLHIVTSYADSKHNFVLELGYNVMLASNDNVYIFIFKVQFMLSIKIILNLKREFD